MPYPGRRERFFSFGCSWIPLLVACKIIFLPLFYAEFTRFDSLSLPFAWSLHSLSTDQPCGFYQDHLLVRTANCRIVSNTGSAAERSDMALFKYISLFLVCVVELSRAASNDEWAQRSIYQVVVDRFARSSDFDAPCNITNYCGGNWAGLVDKLDYIQGMGFTAVQISPINKNLNQTTIYGQAYHGYWPQNLYELNEHFGSESDFKNLVSELHKRDMYILVDVVANEMAYDIGNTTMSPSFPIDYSVFYPFNQESDYMPYCPITNWLNVTEVQNCWLGYEGVATPRINTLNSSINSQLNSWIKELVSNYSIDGIRIDGAKQINYDFLQPFLKSANVYGMAEVDDDIPSYVCNYQKWTGGLENYPLYFTIINAFTVGDMPGLVSMISQMRSACSETQYLATFIENQDNERFPSYVDDINVSLVRLQAVDMISEP